MLNSNSKMVSYVLIILFALHAFGIHGLTESLVYCFEEDGQVVLESKIGSFLTIPSEDQNHAPASHQHDSPTFNTADSNHSDVALSLICLKEQQITRFNQQRTLAPLDGLLNKSVEERSHSRIFQLISFIPPLIEDFITTNLQTVVLLN